MFAKLRLKDFDEYNGNMSRVEQMKKIQNTALELFTKKNIDYGDAFAKYGIIGVLMRIEDKIQRSLSITRRGVNLVNDETIKDTLLDLHNYAAMGLMLLDENSGCIKTPPSISLIVSASRTRGIGINGHLPWSIPDDMNYFKEITIGQGKNVIVMGRKTWSSIPVKFRPLCGRMNIILSSGIMGEEWIKKDTTIIDNPTQVYVAKNIIEVEEKIRYMHNNVGVDKVFVIGGGEIYKEYMDSGKVDEILMTEVDCNHENFDTYFPFIRTDLYKCENISDDKLCHNSGLYYRFLKYTLKK